MNGSTTLAPKTQNLKPKTWTDPSPTLRRMTSPAFQADRNLRLFYALGLVREFTPMLAIWVVYLTDYRHLTLTQVGVMEGLFWGVKLALEVPSGAFADHFGRRATFMAGIGMEAIGTALFAVAGDFTLLVLSYVIWSSGLAFRSGNDEAYLYDTLSSAEREHEYSDRIGVYFALSTVALLAGGLAGGVLAQVANLQIAVLAALIPFALALPVVMSMQEPPRHRVMHALGIVRTLRDGVGAVWRNSELRSIVLLQVTLSGAFPAYFLLSQPFLDSHGVTLALFGVLAVPVHLARTAAGLLSGRVSRRFGLPATLTASLIGVSGGLFLLAAIDHVVAFAGLALAMASVAIALPSIGAYVNERTDSRVRATVLSVGPMGSSIVLATMSVLAGTIAAESLRLSFGVMAVAVLVVGGANLLSWLNAEKRVPLAEVDLAEA
jgi:MFS family permease